MALVAYLSAEQGEDAGIRAGGGGEIILAIYFVAGLAFDWIITRYQLHVIARRAWQAAAYSLVITIVGVVVVQQLVLSIDFFSRVVAYALGCAVGSWWGVRKK